MQIINGCVIDSMRDLLNDPFWNPEEIVDHLILHNGMLDLSLLEKYAPVNVYQRGCSIKGDDSQWMIKDHRGTRLLSSSEKVGVAIRVSGKRGHMECMPLKDLMPFIEGKEFLYLVAMR